jgi:diguanylate cyclase (GGDEF)-like protein
MTLTYCRLFGLEEPQRQARLLLADLGPDDRGSAQELHAWLVLEAANLAGAMAAELQGAPEFARWLSDAERPAFERRLARFLAELGAGFEGGPYFEERLRDTLGWARAGLDLAGYVCAIGRLERRVARALEARPSLRETASKLFGLELSLAGDTYRLVHTDDFRAAVDQLHEALTVDTLTGVSNRLHLLTALNQKLRHAQDFGTPVSLVLADLDHFKQVNDRYGHLAGDAVLKTVSGRMRSTLREADVVGRLGGEEFAMVFDGTSLAGARALAERLRDRVAAVPCEYGQELISVTVSQGVAEFSGHESVESLLARADAALYAAKRTGRNRVMTAEVDGLPARPAGSNDRRPNPAPAVGGTLDVAARRS